MAIDSFGNALVIEQRETDIFLFLLQIEMNVIHRHNSTTE